MEDWRRIDVDQYDPEQQYEADDLQIPQYSAQDVQQKVSIIGQCISTGNTLQGVKAAVDEPLYGTSKEIKQAYLSSILRLLSSAKQSEIPQIISQLSTDETDVLVKFIYAGMEIKEGQRVGGSLLGWLNKVVEVVGQGPIVRYLSDPYKV